MYRSLRLFHVVYIPLFYLPPVIINDSLPGLFFRGISLFLIPRLMQGLFIKNMPPFKQIANGICIFGASGSAAYLFLPQRRVYPGGNAAPRSNPHIKSLYASNKVRTNAPHGWRLTIRFIRRHTWGDIFRTMIKIGRAHV